MTGGTEKAGEINRILAETCKTFGLGMGLGSCRMILDSDEYLKDFNIRAFIGNEQPLFANLGIAQIEDLIHKGSLHKVKELLNKTESDGLIIHINPLQEWLQPEGDRYFTSPVESIKRILDKLDAPLIVKEVGQGFGPASLRALLSLPLQALEFGAFGGTNFSKIEINRREKDRNNGEELIHIGHDAYEMVNFVNEIIDSGHEVNTEMIIVSGGIKDYLDGYYFTEKLKMPAIYAQASAMLKYALQGQEAINAYVEEQIRGLELAEAFLSIK